MRGLEGKRALITGASRGIGRDVALRRASERASVALNYQSGGGEAVAGAKEIADAGGTAIVVPQSKTPDLNVRRSPKPVEQTKFRLTFLLERVAQVGVFIAALVAREP